MPGYKIDHSLILLKFDFGKFQKGKSYLKFNNFLLKDENYVTEIKKIIESTTLLYANEKQNSYPTVAEIQPDKIQLFIEDDLIFDVLLMEI